PLRRKASPVGKFSAVAKTDTLKPCGTTMSSPLPGLNSAVLSRHNGFATVAAWATNGTVVASTPVTYPSSLTFLFDARVQRALIASSYLLLLKSPACVRAEGLRGRF